MRLDDLPQYYFSYNFRSRPVAEGRQIPVSTGYPEPNPWITIPWDQHNVRPDDPAAPAPSLNGWTFLYGPCIVSLDGYAGVGDVQPHASVHLQPWIAADSSEELVNAWEAWEWFVGDLEGNTSHFTGVWHGQLFAGQRLRLRIDYWHATGPAKVNRAGVRGTYWRLPS